MLWLLFQCSFGIILTFDSPINEDTLPYEKKAEPTFTESFIENDFLDWTQTWKATVHEWDIDFKFDGLQ